MADGLPLGRRETACGLIQDVLDRLERARAGDLLEQVAAVIGLEEMTGERTTASEEWRVLEGLVNLYDGQLAQVRQAAEALRQAYCR